MAIRFTVSAPGKVILNGEHSVVYGKAALAGVVGLRNHLTLTNRPHESIEINMDIFPNKTVTYQLSALNKFLSEVHAKIGATLLPADLDHNKFLSYVSEFVKAHKGEVNTTHSEAYEKTLTAIIYLLSAIVLANSDAGSPPQLAESFVLDFKSDITMGAGLGSSASFAVCLAGTFYFYAMLQKNPQYLEYFNKIATPEQRTEILTNISSWAFCSERIMHGTPSGLDNAICTFGNVFKFYKGVKPINVNLRTKINILLVDTKVSRSTANVVKKVAEFKAEHSELIGHILDAMGSLVEDVVQILENKQSLPEEVCYEKLKNLYYVNNNLLRAIGVSHPSLEQIFSISEKHGFSSKLTGAGAGGYAIVLLPPNFKELPAFKLLGDELTANGFPWKDTTIGGLGFQIRR